MPKPRDIGNEETEELLKRLEKRLKKEYEQATKEVEEKFKDYMRRFEIKDEIRRKAVEAGVLKESDYKKWRQSQIFNGERWEAMLNALSQDLKNVSDIAISTARGYQAEAYAINHNFATYLIERDSKVNTSYTLYDRQTVERLIREDPKLLPDPKPGGKTARKLAENKELRWNRQHITSAVMQGVVQGETVPQMAKRLESVGEMDHRAAIRNARTMVTGAQNAGRIDATKRARDMGIGLTNVWMATLDMRTRHEHRVLDGQRREVGEPFEVEGEKIMYPGDPKAAPRLVYNCRCTLIPQINGFEYDIRGDARTDYSDIEGMTYDEWKKDRREKPNPITLPEEKAEAARQSYNAEYRKLRKETLAKTESNVNEYQYYNKQNRHNYPQSIQKHKDIQDRFSKLEGNLIDKSMQIDAILDDYATKKSKWSKKTIVVDQISPGVIGKKEWSCDIKLKSDAGIKVVIHEHLHARSVSYFTEQEFKKWKAIEEGTVELYSQTICAANNIDFRSAYNEHVDKLRAINAMTKKYDDDFDFAKDLFDKPMNERYNYLEQLVNNVVGKGIYNKNKEKELRKILDHFKSR